MSRKHGDCDDDRASTNHGADDDRASTNHGAEKYT